jgi:serine/threonine-protein kinase RsbW
MLASSDNSLTSTMHHSLWQRGCRTARLSALQAMPALVNSVGAAMREQGYADRDIFGVQVAIDEAVTNAVKHGHHEDPTKTVKVRYAVQEDFVVVEIADEGPGFDPSLVPDPTSAENLERTGGRGLLLIHFYMSWAHYNRRGNVLTFCKYPSTPLCKPDDGSRS